MELFIWSVSSWLSWRYLVFSGCIDVIGEMKWPKL